MKSVSDSEDDVKRLDNITKPKNPLPKKITVSIHDQVGTKKSKSDPFSELCDRILSEKQKLKQGFPEEKPQITILQQEDEVMEYDPHYKTGIIENYRETTEQQKIEYGLKDEGKCQQFTLNNQFLIVIIGRLPLAYTNNTKISLYLPRSMLKPPQPTIHNKQLVKIQRRSQSGDTNFLNYPYIIVQPQTLLYPSYLCSWIDCKRRISLTNYVSSEFEVNQVLVFGSACHRYMEWLLDKEVDVDNKNLAEFKEIIKKIYDSFLYDMYLINATFEDFWAYCEQSLNNIRLWVKNYIFLKKEIEVNKYQKQYLVITEVVGSQTMHRSKYFGLKGKTDGLFKGKLIDRMKNTTTEVSIPFELKTGKRSSDSHKRQTDIYNMLLRQSTKGPVLGLLYYSEGNFTVFRSESSQIAFETIVIHRNTILMNLKKLYSTEKINLPAFVSNMDSCKMCDMAAHCEMFHIGQKMAQEGSSKYKTKYCKSLPPSQVTQTTGDDSKPKDSKSAALLKDLESIFEDSDADEQVPSDFNSSAKQNLNNLSFPQVSYINTWMKWLHYEQKQVKQSIQKNLKQGFNNFLVKFEQLPKFKTYFTSNLEQKLKFMIQKDMKTAQQMQNIMTFYQPSQKMRIIIQHLGIMQGCKITRTKKHQSMFIMEIQMNSKEVPMNRRALEYSIQNKVDHDVELERFESLQVAGLRNTIFNFVFGGNQKLKSIVLEGYVLKEDKKQKKEKSKNDEKDEALNQQSLPANNKDINQPEESQENSLQQPIPITLTDKSTLNPNQQEAFQKVFTSSYFTLIEGMPGTGKTQLILRLIQKCHSLNKSVLITTFTNRSLDNILQRTFKSNKIPISKIIRQGSRYSIDQKFQNLNSRSQTFTTIAEYKQYFQTKQLWFVTLASINIHHIPKQFDFIILDQASQSLEPACIQALSRGSKIVMIGDYKQLQPIVKSQKAQKQGMSISLFQRLCMHYPDNTISLRLQYRMNKEIMKLSNTLVYDDQLEVGTEEVGDKVLLFRQNWKDSLGNQETLIKIINPSQPVVFLNHDGLTNALSLKYRDRKDEITQVLQVQISSYLFYKLHQLGIPSNNMTIVCVYNKTVEIVMRLLKKSHQRLSKSEPFKNEGQVLTIDKSQGIDKEVIIFLAENRDSVNNILLENCRRLNVALTRAKSKLIIIGSMKFLSQMTTWKGKLSTLLENRTYPITKPLIDHILNEFKDIEEAANKEIDSDDEFSQL